MLDQATRITGVTDTGVPVHVSVTLNPSTGSPAPTDGGETHTAIFDSIRAAEQPPVPTVSAGPPMVGGMTVAPPDFAQLWPGGRAEHAEFCRTYAGEGEGILSWTHPRRLMPTHVVDFHSWTDWPSDTAVVKALTQLLDTMPRGLLEGEALLPHLRPYDPDRYGPDPRSYDGFSLILSYWHDGEGMFAAQGLDVAEWRRRHALAYRVVRQHHNGHRVAYMPVQTNAWTEAHSRPGYPRGDFDPLSWWAGVGDFAGYTAYATPMVSAPGRGVRYTSASEFLAVAQRLANGTGRPLFLSELGVTLPDGDEDGQHRAAWIRALGQDLRAAGVAGAGWLDALTPSGWDFRLVDGPSARAWSDVLLGREIAGAL